MSRTGRLWTPAGLGAPDNSEDQQGEDMTWQTSDSISLVSALAAIASAIYAGKTYWATVALKKHDTGLQLRLANETLRATVLALPDQLARTRQSHQNVLAANGLGRSGQMQAWEQRAEELQTEIHALQQRLPGEPVKDALDLGELNDLISATHGFQQRAVAVRDELAEVMRQDDRQRDHIREDHRANMAARLAQPGRT
jgi:hypothetical protein